jgi:uncharacterized protein
MLFAEFSILHGLAGGALIGLAAFMLMLFNGRILGMSGILGGLLNAPRDGDSAWRPAFILGMSVPAVVLGLSGNYAPQGNGLGLPLILAAGFLVGFGSRMGNGCTSGHGICGLARLSKRSLAAVATFMAVSGIAVYVLRHGIGG